MVWNYTATRDLLLLPGLTRFCTCYAAEARNHKAWVALVKRETGADLSALWAVVRLQGSLQRWC